jgi:hypothetical protein
VEIFHLIIVRPQGEIKVMSDLAQQLVNLQAALQMGGEHNEGTSGDRGDLIGTGDTCMMA